MEKMHLQPYMTDRFGTAEVHLKHPDRSCCARRRSSATRRCLMAPMPDWFDTTYFNDQVKPHFNLRGEISRAARNCVLVVRYLFNHPEALDALLRCSSRWARRRRRCEPVEPDAFWFHPPRSALLAWGIYAMVNTEERYVTFAYFCILLPLFAHCARLRPTELPASPA